MRSTQSQDLVNGGCHDLAWARDFITTTWCHKAGTPWIKVRTCQNSSIAIHICENIMYVMSKAWCYWIWPWTAALRAVGCCLVHLQVSAKIPALWVFRCLICGKDGGSFQSLMHTQQSKNHRTWMDMVHRCTSCAIARLNVHESSRTQNQSPIWSTGATTIVTKCDQAKGRRKSLSERIATGS